MACFRYFGDAYGFGEGYSGLKAANGSDATRPETSSEEPDFHRRWRTIAPPFRPHPHVADSIRALLADSGELTLLLGVTPELAQIPQRVVAVDWDSNMLACAWPGDTAKRRAVLGDWRNLPLEPGTAAAAIGDGSLTMLRYPTDQRLLLDQLGIILRPGSRVIIRCFAQPLRPDTVEEVCEAAWTGIAFHSFKMRFNMAVAAEAGHPTVICGDIFARFDALFDDQERLAAANGWNSEALIEMRAYQGSSSILTFASRQQLLDLLPDWTRHARFVETDGYPLADRCPLLVFEVP